MEAFQEFRNTDTDIERNLSLFMIKQQHHTLNTDEEKQNHQHVLSIVENELLSCAF